MYTAEQKSPFLNTLNPVVHIKHWSQCVRRFAANFAWVFEKALTSESVSLGRKSKFIVRTLLNLKSSASWFQYVRDGYLQQAIKSEPSLLEIIHRPFFDRHINSTQRAKMLASHFELLLRLLGARKTADIMHGSRVLLSQFSGKNEENFAIHLVRQDAFKREGGVTLELSMNDAALLYLTFTMTNTGQGKSIKVGGVQSSRINCRDLTREATHALHGVQPRLLLIEALRSIAGMICCTSIECVGKENHIHRAWRYRLKKSISAEYDQLWLLAGGQLNSSGNFEIPCVVHEKPIESRPSNKRSEYRRRAAVLAAMRMQIHSVLHRGSIQALAFAAKGPDSNRW